MTPSSSLEGDLFSWVSVFSTLRDPPTSGILWSCQTELTRPHQPFITFSMDTEATEQLYKQWNLQRWSTESKQHVKYFIFCKWFSIRFTIFPPKQKTSSSSSHVTSNNKKKKTRLHVVYLYTSAVLLCTWQQDTQTPAARALGKIKQKWRPQWHLPDRFTVCPIRTLRRVSNTKFNSNAAAERRSAPSAGGEDEDGGNCVWFSRLWYRYLHTAMPTSECTAGLENSFIQ